MVSNRAIEITNECLSTPLHDFDIHIVSDQLEGHEVYFNTTDLSFSIIRGSDEGVSAFLCAYFTLLKKMGPGQLKNIDFKIVENFLRDQNHVLAWSDVDSLRPWFEKSLEVIVSGIVSSLLLDKVSIKCWDELSLKDRLIMLKADIVRANTKLSIFGLDGVELVSVEENNILISSPMTNSSEYVWNGYNAALSSFLQFSYTSSLINLVAQ